MMITSFYDIGDMGVKMKVCKFCGCKYDGVEDFDPIRPKTPDWVIEEKEKEYPIKPFILSICSCPCHFHKNKIYMEAFNEISNKTLS